MSFYANAPGQGRKSRIGPKEREDLVWQYVRDYTDENGYGPTVREIANHIDTASLSTVHVTLESLRKAGRVTGNKTRTLKAV